MKLLGDYWNVIILSELKSKGRILQEASMRRQEPTTHHGLLVCSLASQQQFHGTHIVLLGSNV